jgi:hypothetical protein
MEGSGLPWRAGRVLLALINHMYTKRVRLYGTTILDTDDAMDDVTESPCSLDVQPTYLLLYHSLYVLRGYTRARAARGLEELISAAYIYGV